jgi:hypothetical protein
MNDNKVTKYKILFADQAPYEYKHKILETIIKLYNQGCSNLAIVAELNLSVFQRDDDEQTIKFIYVGV